MNVMDKPRLRGMLVAAAMMAATFAGAGQATAESVLHVGNMGEPASLDPHYVSGTWENRIVGDMFLGLTTAGPDGQTVPGAAESWRTTVSAPSASVSSVMGTANPFDPPSPSAHVRAPVAAV